MGDIILLYDFNACTVDQKVTLFDTNEAIILQQKKVA